MSDLHSKQIRTIDERYSEIDLHLIINVVKHSYKIVLLITMLFFLCGIYLASIQPAVYCSTALIDVKNSGVSSIISGAVPFSSGGSSTSNIEKALLQTPYVLGDVVKQMGYDISLSPKSASFFAKGKKKHNRIFSTASVSVLSVPNILLDQNLILLMKNANSYSLATPNGQTILNGVVGKIAKGTYLSLPVLIQVDQLRGLPGAQFNVVKRPVTDVANSLSKGFAIAEDGRGTGVLQLNYYASSPEQAQTVLNAILAVALKKSRHQQALEATHMLMFLRHQLPRVDEKLNASEAKIDAYDAKTGVYDFPAQERLLEVHLVTLQNALKKLQEKKIQLLQSFTSKHPIIIATNEEESQLRNQINDTRAAFDKLPIEGEPAINLTRNLKIEEKIYEGMLSNAQKMQMMKAGIISNVRVLDYASYPTSTIPTKKTATVLASIVFGMLAGLGFVFMRHILSPIVDDPDMIEQRLGVAVAAILPCSQQQMSFDKKIARSKNYAYTNPFLLAHEDPNDLAIEGIRSLRTTIQMLLLEAKGNVVAITGCAPSVGKSFVSANLASVFADLNKRVLLIDADIRRGKLWQAFGKTKEPGLSSLLEGRATLEHIIQSVVPEKLDFIATGLFPTKPSELLSSSALGNFIETVRHRYDLVIIDTPPILAVTDAALILKFTATNLMVLGVGKDHLKEVEHAKKLLEKCGVTLHGIVFNTTSQNKTGFGYNYHYGKYNYHYSYDNK